MKIREVSDVHTEFFGEDEIAKASLRILPPLPDDAETVLILAGDIGAAGKLECLDNFIGAVAPRFKAVFEIPGNHEYYHGNLLSTNACIAAMLERHDNLLFTGMGSAMCGPDRRLHMATLWSDFDGGNPQSMLDAQMRMNDYRLILNGEETLYPQDTYDLHKLMLEYLEKNIAEGDIVMTHHTPSMQCIPAEYLHDRVNGAYHSDLDDLILRKKPALWFCGHTHTAKDFYIGTTRVIINPRGYGNQHKHNGYNPTMVVEI